MHVSEKLKCRSCGIKSGRSTTSDPVPCRDALGWHHVYPSFRVVSVNFHCCIFLVLQIILESVVIAPRCQFRSLRLLSLE